MEWPTSSRSHSTSHVRDEARHPLAKACDQCHRCKVACNGGRPTCDRCAMNDSACTYSTGKPIGKPKGSKNRSKLEAQRVPTNKVDTAPSTQPSENNSCSKRKTSAGASPEVHQLADHKRHRSSISLSSPISPPNGRVLGFVGEPELSSGASIPSVNPSEQLELQAGHTATSYPAPTPESLKLQLSSSHPPGVELDFSFDHDIDFAQDWNFTMDNDGPQHKSALNAFLPTLEHPSFTHPVLTLVGGSHASNDMANTKMAVNESPQDASQADRGECSCTAESLAIIPRLQQYSTGRIKLSVDGVLRLTRSGTCAISNHLDCSHHTKSQTSLLACILILMQIAACYAFLCSSLEDPEYQKQFPVSVGGLSIEEDETRRHVINAVLEAEVRKAATLSARLEEWGLQLSNALPCKPLLSFVRQELDRALEQREST